jgi:hypothetical protein
MHDAEMEGPQLLSLQVGEKGPIIPRHFENHLGISANLVSGGGWPCWTGLA